MTFLREPTNIARSNGRSPLLFFVRKRLFVFSTLIRTAVVRTVLYRTAKYGGQSSEKRTFLTWAGRFRIVRFRSSAEVNSDRVTTRYDS